MPRTRRIHTLGIWMGLTGGVTPELTEGMPHIQDPYSKLVAFQEEMGRLTQEQAFYDARKQEVTRRMNEILSEGRIVATVLQAVLKQHFGPRSEELVEFGIKPFRGLKRARKAEKKAAAPEPSAE
ncbi:MAG TPA: hypothetical protein VGQ28_03455 [Thermoanaerobaculia bacterium]|jgi:hypothetical protein|nr:hypothetical protein [Thermoanaerobaculia bacterium]